MTEIAVVIVMMLIVVKTVAIVKYLIFNGCISW